MGWAALHDALASELGFDIGHSETPIIPVMIGDEDLAKTFSGRLFEEGVFALGKAVRHWRSGCCRRASAKPTRSFAPARRNCCR